MVVVGGGCRCFGGVGIYNMWSQVIGEMVKWTKLGFECIFEKGVWLCIFLKGKWVKRSKSDFGGFN